MRRSGSTARSLRRRWREALLGGEYEQTRGAMIDGVGGHCCLAVLSDINGESNQHYPQEYLHQMFSDRDKRSTTSYWISLNDNAELSFEEIAKKI